MEHLMKTLNKLFPEVTFRITEEYDSTTIEASLNRSEKQKFAIRLESEELQTVTVEDVVWSFADWYGNEKEPQTLEEYEEYFRRKRANATKSGLGGNHFG